MAIVHSKEAAEGFNYIIVSERGEKEPFTVKLKVIDSTELVRLQDGLLLRGNDDSISLKTGSYNVSALRLSITGWNNMLDAKGKQIPMAKKVNGLISDDSLNMIPASLFDEIAGVAIDISNDTSKIQLHTAE